MTGEQLDRFDRFGGAFGFEGVSTTATSLTVGRDLSWADWEKLVVGLVAAAAALPWFIGDALAYGEERFGESYAQISGTLERYGLRVAPGTLANWVSVAARVPPSRRREGVSWSLHAEVAKFDPVRQRELLGRAASEGWSVRELRDELALESLPVASPVEKPSARALQLERVIDVAKTVVSSCLPSPSGEVCIPGELFERLAAAVHGEAEA